jgi:hypothetical protein
MTEHLDMRVRPLVEMLNTLPGVMVVSSCGGHPPPLKEDEWHEGTFFVQFHVDTSHKAAWQVVQGLAWLVNNDMQQKGGLPIIFHPIASPPNLEPGAKWYLDWMIEGYSVDVHPSTVAAVLSGALPVAFEWGSGDPVGGVDGLKPRTKTEADNST